MADDEPNENSFAAKLAYWTFPIAGVLAVVCMIAALTIATCDQADGPPKTSLPQRR